MVTAKSGSRANRAEGVFSLRHHKQRGQRKKPIEDEPGQTHQQKYREKNQYRTPGRWIFVGGYGPARDDCAKDADQGSQSQGRTEKVQADKRAYAPDLCVRDAVEWLFEILEQGLQRRRAAERRNHNPGEQKAEPEDDGGLPKAQCAAVKYVLQRPPHQARLARTQQKQVLARNRQRIQVFPAGKHNQRYPGKTQTPAPGHLGEAERWAAKDCFKSLQRGGILFHCCLAYPNLLPTGATAFIPDSQVLYSSWPAVSGQTCNLPRMRRILLGMSI